MIDGGRADNYELDGTWYRRKGHTSWTSDGRQGWKCDGGLSWKTNFFPLVRRLSRSEVKLG